VPRVVLVLDWPAKGQPPAGQAGKRPLEEAVHSLAPALEHCSIERRPRRYEPLALLFTPAF
jgi:hypothetical protein